jgi:hypothetical protein
MRIDNACICFVGLILFSCQNQSDKPNAISDSTNELSHKNDSLNFEPTTIKQSRYSIIQSAITAKGTYKLDGFTGDVYVMVVDKKGDLSWEKIKKLDHDEPDIRYDNIKNYILTISTIAMKFTYLMNTNRGATWQLFQDSATKELFFSPIE